MSANCVFQMSNYPFSFLPMLCKDLSELAAAQSHSEHHMHFMSPYIELYTQLPKIAHKCFELLLAV